MFPKYTDWPLLNFFNFMVSKNNKIQNIFNYVDTMGEIVLLPRGSDFEQNNTNLVTWILLSSLKSQFL